MGPSEASVIPEGFRRVYGEDYLSAAVYDEAAIARALEDGSQRSFLATAPDGSFAGHIALTRGAPNTRMFETAQGIVDPDHRRAGLLRHLFAMMVESARADPDCDALFGTALTNHTISQKVLGQYGFRDTGLEIDYVPQRMLVSEGVAGPIATLVQYLDFGKTEAAPAYLTPELARWAARLLPNGARAGAVVPVAHAPAPEEEGRLEVRDMPRFDMARLTVARAGADLPDIVSRVEAKAAADGRRTTQVVVALDRPGSAWAVEQLRAAGYAFSGLLPRFFPGNAHGGIFYRSFAVPNFKEIRTWSDTAAWLLEEVRADWQARPAARPARRAV
jgi:RimJ/RimL family protein N-acetyltransferase